MVYIECSVSNTTTKDIKYTVCLKRTVESNPSITLCEPLESLTKGDHSITEYYSSSSNLDQNHFFLKFIWHTVLFVSCLLTFNINRKLSKKTNLILEWLIINSSANSCNRVINYHKTQWIHAEKMPLMLQYCTVISCKCIKKTTCTNLYTIAQSHRTHYMCYNSIQFYRAIKTPKHL